MTYRISVAPIPLDEWNRICAGLSRMGMTSLDEYRRSKRWAGLVQQMKEELGHMPCWVCGDVGSLNVHHTTYAHLGLITELCDLIWLCLSCHTTLHDTLMTAYRRGEPACLRTWHLDMREHLEHGWPWFDKNLEKKDETKSGDSSEFDRLFQLG